MPGREWLARDRRSAVPDRRGHHRDRSSSAHDLSDEERTILALLADGLTFGQVASRAGLSERTVRRRIENAGRVLGTRTTIEAVAVAVRCSLV